MHLTYMTSSSEVTFVERGMGVEGGPGRGSGAGWGVGGEALDLLLFIHCRCERCSPGFIST